MSITISSPPARPTVNQFEITDVKVSAGAVDATVEVRCGSTPMRTFVVQVRAGSGIGLRYAASGGDVEGYTRTAGSIAVGAAFTAFAGASGGFGSKASALETWLQGQQLLPS
jgi:hypothetical protein